MGLGRLPEDVVDAYLRRLGLDREPPSAGALARLHRAHVERVPYETMWIHEGLAWDIDPTAAAHRIAVGGRGGYCFHLNGALAALLGALGYDVTLHRGGVHGPGGPDAEMLSNHLVLGVHGLPADGCPDGRWYVDAGLGDALHEPAPWVVGPVDQPPLHLVLETVEAGGVGDWHLVHDERGAFAGMSFEAAPTTMAAFADRHRWLSASPESGFVRVLSAQRRTATTTDAVRGVVRIVVTDAGTETTVVDDRDDWLALLADDFGLVPADPDALWDRVRTAHETWAATGGG